MNKRYYYLITIICVVFLVVLGFLRFRQEEEVTSEQFLMDTLVSIRVTGDEQEKLQEAVQKAFGEMKRIEELTDRFQAAGSSSCTSEICRVNSAAGKQAQVVDSDVFTMLVLAKEYADLSGGAFDITIGPLLDLWGFGKAEQKVPSAEDIKKALALVDYRELVLDDTDNSVLLKKTGMSLDLGGIAKGYAAGKALQVLQEHGVKSALLNAGGNISVWGQKADKKPWMIGIQDPRDPGEVIGALTLNNESAVTSGDYNRYFIYKGRRYHHIISPFTGYPADKNMSVTVVASDPGIADILSTTLFVLDYTKGLQIVEKLEGVDALFVTADRKIVISSGLKEKFTIKQGKDYTYEESGLVSSN